MKALSTKTVAILFAILFSLSSALAQTQNALDFDGINDEVNVANASAQIVNQSGFSLTCWVLPTQNANWPNMEAFAGFRDNFECDFYLLQTYGTTMEGRFRNSANVVYTLDSAGLLTLDTWQHLALTYDGAYLSMYRNGVLLESIAASGTITTSTGMFRIGNMPIPGSSEIFLDGQVDEATLWKRGLTEAEVQCIMNNGANPSDADLQLYYRMDQGVPGGSNTGLTALVDAAGNQNGTLAGFALSGATSNYVAGSPNDGTTQATICSGDSYELNGELLTQSGTYTTTIPLGGCDSVVVLELVVTPVNVSVAQSANLLIAQAAGATYQWINCVNNAPIAGAIGQYYTATANGDYAVIIGQNSCTDTSACYNVTGIGIEELELPVVRIWPQPASGVLNIEFSYSLAKAELSIYEMTGRLVYRRSLTANSRAVLDVSDLVPGAYLLELGALGRTRVVRFVRD